MVKKIKLYDTLCIVGRLTLTVRLVVYLYYDTARSGGRRRRDKTCYTCHQLSFLCPRLVDGWWGLALHVCKDRMVTHRSVAVVHIVFASWTIFRFIDAARILRGAGSMKRFVRPSVPVTG